MDWSPLAITTLALAAVAFAAIMQTRNIHRNAQRQRLLDEILEWAIKIAELNYELDKELANLPSIEHFEDAFQMTLSHMARLSFSMESRKSKNMYIVRISSRFGDTLQEAVTDLVKLFQICLERVDEYTKSIAGKTVKTADECRYILKDLPSFESDLEKLAIEVIDEVARIKTKGIS